MAQFLTMATWKACGEARCCQRLERPSLFRRSRPRQYARDMTALVLVFADDDGGFDVVPYCWLPGETLQEREDEDRMPYRVWAQQGHLLTFDGRTTDPQAVALKIAELHGIYDIRRLAFDRWKMLDFQRELNAIGCTVPMVPWGQGFKDMGFAVDVLEKLVEEKKTAARKSSGPGYVCG